MIQTKEIRIRFEGEHIDEMINQYIKKNKLNRIHNIEYFGNKALIIYEA